jgi:hypothetical protein
MCAAFTCVWLRGNEWPAHWRPDRVGLMCLCETLSEDMPAAAVYEVQPDALLRPDANEIIDSLLRKTAVVVVINLHQQRRRLIGQWRTVCNSPAIAPPHVLPVAACNSLPALSRMTGPAAA